jgi:UDP-glucose 4-epimerase
MLLRNKKIIVTGGAGFIGSHVVDRLISDGNEVIIIDDFSTGKWENIDHHKENEQLQVEEADIRDVEKMARLSKGVDIVFHMAVACLRTSLHDPIGVHEINATATLHLCRAAYENNVERFIYVSSSEAYGSASHVPMDENHPLNPTTVYGASKAAGELYTLAYWRTYGYPTMVVRPFNTYGPREPSESHRAEVIPKFVIRGMAGLQPVIFGTGKQTRDFTWVEDTAQGIIMAAECDDLIGDSVNIARGQEVTIERICKLVIEALGDRDLEPSYLEEGRPGDVERHYADISKAQKLVGYSPTVDIEEGIHRYVEWIKQQNIDIDAWVEQEQVRNW